MSKPVRESPVFLLSLGRDSDRWRVALRTAEATHYFVTWEDLVLFLDEQSQRKEGGEWREAVGRQSCWVATCFIL